MQWTKPDFQEVSLNMEVTAYVYTDEAKRAEEKTPRVEEPAPARTVATSA